MRPMSPTDAPSSTRWPLRLRDDLSEADVDDLRATVEEIAARSQYGWGHTIDFGPFTMPGLLGDKYLRLAGHFDELGWWPEDLSGLRVADIGCFSGGLTALLAARGAEVVHAVDEVPEHLEQCRAVADAFGLDNVVTHERSLYQLPEVIEEESLDLILFAGTLYHLSDMQVGLVTLQRLLRPGGTLLIESNAVEDFEHSYANFGRYFGGMWWQPTALCVIDMCEHAGLEAPTDVRFYQPERLIAAARKGPDARVPFRRGLNIEGIDRRDDVERTLTPGAMAPAPNPRSQVRMLYGWADRALRLPMRLGYLYRRLTRRSRESR